jgi:DNA-binding transcriptional LysR family regulator
LARETLSGAAPFQPLASRRVFKVSANDFAATLLMARLVTTLADEAPEARLSIGFAGGPRQAFAGLRAGDLDAALGRFPELPDDIFATPVFDDDYLVIARTDHPRLRDGLDLEAYLELGHVIVSFSGDLRGTVDADLERRGLARKVVAASPMFLTAFATVASNDLIATAPRRLATRFAAAFGLKTYEPPFPTARFSIDLIRVKTSSGDGAINWLVEQIRDAADGDRQVS